MAAWYGKTLPYVAQSSRTSQQGTGVGVDNRLKESKSLSTGNWSGS